MKKVIDLISFGVLIIFFLAVAFFAYLISFGFDNREEFFVSLFDGGENNQIDINLTEYSIRKRFPIYSSVSDISRFVSKAGGKCKLLVEGRRRCVVVLIDKGLSLDGVEINFSYENDKIIDIDVKRYWDGV